MTCARTDRDILGRFAIAGLILSYLLLANCDTIIPRHSWSREWGPMVPHDTFPGDCGICHVSDRWDVLREDFSFDHEAETGFALEGAHSKALCLRCHNDRGPVKVYVERGCGGCHVDPHQGNLGLVCTECHNQDLWEPGGLIAEHANTGFALLGAHAVTPCERCHQRATVGQFRGTPVECHLCHQRDVARAVPNHQINGWNVECERCHIPLNWQAPGFDHTGFPLLGGHAAVDCLQCHPNGLFVGTDPNCYACHQNDYQTAPNHVANNFSTDCTLCHNIFAWK